MRDTGPEDENPRRAVWATLGDAVSRRWCFLESKGLCAAARRRTGLEDFGDPPIEPALSVLTESLEKEANLHPLGRFLMRVHLRGLLETRLRLAEVWRGQPEAMASSPIRRPVFITGMPRSGSTFLHELLAQDPDNRAPRVWEVMFPIPAAAPEQLARDPRVRKAAACLWWFRRLAPQADEVFPMRACTPHECVAIHSYTLLSEEFISSCRIPGYEAFLRAADLRPAYVWQRRFLQHLQLRSPARRWVLKSPDHVYGLEELFAVFPDAVVIQTHRNPLEVLKSSCQLTEVLQGLFARPGKREQLGARESRVLAESMERFMRFRDAHPKLADRFIDVTYTELVSDPLATVRRIYQGLDLPLTEAAVERMRGLVSARSRYQNRHAAARLAELGLHVPAEARRFEQYCSRFGVPWQQAGLR
jgi:hypothetical protein